MKRSALFMAGFSLFLLAACDDPKDPRTWVKKLRDPQKATEAVKKLGELKDPSAIKPLCDLYADFESPTILKAIILFKDKPQFKEAIPTLIKALEFTEDKYHNATLAAKALADVKAVDAIDPLCKVLDKPLPIKSRANLAKLAAIKALGDIGDKRAVPCLVKTLERTPEQQDFKLNKDAADALGELRDPSAVPVLIRGLFMASTIQGTSYPMSKVALVKIGKSAVPMLVNALKGKDEKLNELGKTLEFKEGVITQKVSIVLGDMMANEAVPALLEVLANTKIKPDDEEFKGLDGVIEALGKIGDESSVDPLVKMLLDKKASYKLRMQVCMALTVMGPKKALPALLEVAEKGEIEGGYTNLMEGAAMAYGRIAGAEAEVGIAKIKAVMAGPKLKDYKETQDLFKEVLERLEVARECKDDPLCYGKKVTDESLKLVQKEKAGIMIGVLADGRKALPDLIRALPNREPVLRLYFLQAARKIGNAGDKQLIKTLETLSEKDSQRTVKALGADLASEDKVALAVISSKPAK
jgi:HEAT repeat protein